MHEFSVKPVYPDPDYKPSLWSRVKDRVSGWLVRALNYVLPLPGPRELGRSESGALPGFGFLSEEQKNDPDLYTWEDWEEEVKRDYPIAYYLRHTFPSYFWVPKRRIGDAWYWAKCKLLPSYKFHLLDLRTKDGGVNWGHGWRDRSFVLLIANFHILCQFVEKESAHDPCEGMTSEEKEGCKDHPHVIAHNEMMSLYCWWKTGREAAHKEYARLLNDWYMCEDPVEKAKLWPLLGEREKALEKADQDNLHRLIEIREYLWT